MAFQVKRFLSITASMINHTRGSTQKLTDFSVGSVIRTLYEAYAIETDELYQQMFLGLKESIPVAIYLAFDFTRLPAVAAYGTVTFTTSDAGHSQAIVIPAGTLVKVPNGTVTYATTADCVIPVGSVSASVTVAANTTGVIGNVISGSITEMANPISGITVTNTAAIASGRNEETDAQRKERFKRFIAALSRAPAASVEYGAESAKLVDSAGAITEYVKDALVHEPYLAGTGGPGYIDVYVWNGSSGASAALVAEVQRVIDGYYDSAGDRVMGWKAAGIVATVSAVTMQSQDVTAAVEMEDGYTFDDREAAIEAVIRDYLDNLDIGEDLIRNELIHRMMAVEGVYNVEVTAPSSAVVSVQLSHKMQTGTVTLTQL